MINRMNRIYTILLLSILGMLQSDFIYSSTATIPVAMHAPREVWQHILSYGNSGEDKIKSIIAMKFVNKQFNNWLKSKDVLPLLGALIAQYAYEKNDPAIIFNLKKNKVTQELLRGVSIDESTLFKHIWKNIDPADPKWSAVYCNTLYSAAVYSSPEIFTIFLKDFRINPNITVYNKIYRSRIKNRTLLDSLLEQLTFELRAFGQETYRSISIKKMISLLVNDERLNQGCINQSATYLVYESYIVRSDIRRKILEFFINEAGAKMSLHVKKNLYAWAIRKQ